MSTPDLDEPIGARAPADAAAAAAAEGWKPDKQGRQYITIPGRKGPLYRRGEETVAERIERAQRPADEAPKASKKRKQPAQPAAPDDFDLKVIEKAIAEALASPAMLAGLAGDVYLAQHFATQGPRLARVLVVTADSSPWLRRQLEQLAAGGSTALNVMGMLGLAVGIVGYVAPPIIYLFNLPAPAMAREMFQIPERRPTAADNGSTPPVQADSPAAPAGS